MTGNYRVGAGEKVMAILVAGMLIWLPLVGTLLIAGGPNPHNAGSIFLLLGMVTVGTGCFFLPAIIAFRKAHPNRWPILFLCMLGPFWIVAILWATNRLHHDQDNTN